MLQSSANWRDWPPAAKLQMLTRLRQRQSTSTGARSWTPLLRTLHARQCEFAVSTAKRRVIRAGRRGGKTVGVATLAVMAFATGRRVLYAVPTDEQVTRFWYECKRALAAPLSAGILYRNETQHVIEMPGTLNRIRAKTAWNADTLRGDFADLLILDEYQLMDEDAWGVVGAPMLLDNNGDAVFVYTPPSLRTRAVSKARDKMHAAKLYKKAAADTTGRWAVFHFSSRENPYISEQALSELTGDMTALTIRQEIDAEDMEDAPGALWTRELIERTRVTRMPELLRVVVGVDPPGGATECGIVTAGRGVDGDLYVFADHSLQAGPAQWGSAVVSAYLQSRADRVLGEKNFGGDMVEHTIRTVRDGQDKAVGQRVAYANVTASRGKQVRAEPVAALWEQGHAHIVGSWPQLEDECCTWQPGMPSPNRMDAMVWAASELMLGPQALPVAPVLGTRQSYWRAV